MATSFLSDHIFRPLPYSPHRRLTTFKPTGISPSKNSRTRNLVAKTDNKKKLFKWVVRLSLAEQSPPKSTVDVKRLVDFLYEDLPHLFDDQGIDRTAYDERIKFRDPITKHDGISGYLFNIDWLKKLFSPDFKLHWAKQVWFYQIVPVHVYLLV